MVFDFDRIDLFVLDMDGTFYLDNTLIDGAKDFLRIAKDAGKDVIFFTNNASTTAFSYQEKLKRLGVTVSVSDILTAGDVMIDYLLENHRGKSVYVLGTGALRQSFLDAGIRVTTEEEAKCPDIVVVSFDKELTYGKLSHACRCIREGAQFFATHPDINCPTQDGFLPDCGAILCAVSASTGQEAKVITGKPSVETVKAIEKRRHIHRCRMAFVGDRLYTDIRAGCDNGAFGLLVLSGETKEADVKTSDIVPDAVFSSIREIGECIRHG